MYKKVTLRYYKCTHLLVDPVVCGGEVVGVRVVLQEAGRERYASNERQSEGVQNLYHWIALLDTAMWSCWEKGRFQVILNLKIFIKL